MRSEIASTAEGNNLRGWLYRPSGKTDPVPAVVMAHGFPARREPLR